MRSSFRETWLDTFVRGMYHKLEDVVASRGLASSPLARFAARHGANRLATAVAQHCYGPPLGPTGVTIGELAAQVKLNAAEASRHSPLDLLWFKQQVQDNAPWDYKKYDPAFENFGNYNYGYTGEAQGIPARVLYDAAGLAQLKSNTWSKNWFSSNWDDPRDQEQIRRGISDRRNGC